MFVPKTFHVPSVDLTPSSHVYGLGASSSRRTCTRSCASGDESSVHPARLVTPANACVVERERRRRKAKGGRREAVRERGRRRERRKVQE